MTEQIELQACQHCMGEFDLQGMTMMGEYWFCQPCVEDWQKHFDACDHKWSPYTDEMGDPGQYCENCSGFVRDEDFPTLFPSAVVGSR